jgi:curli biogenesis system outer membrane secretion channel CsgG
MRQILIMRHEKQEPSLSLNDFNITLTEEGEAPSVMAEKAFQGENIFPDSITSTQATRTESTIGIVTEGSRLKTSIYSMRDSFSAAINQSADSLNGASMKAYLIPLLILLFLLGCSRPQVTIHKKSGVDFSKYKNIAVLKFNSSDPAIGQEVADTIALQFMNKGYSVVERSQLKAVIDENSIIASGLTDNNLVSLKLKGIDAILVGSVSRYNCEQSAMTVPTKMGAIKGSRNLCHVSISMKILNVQDGDILWAAQASNSVKGRNMTAGTVLSYVLQEIEGKIP